MKLIDLVFGAILTAIGLNMGGCAILDRDGFEISASAGIHRVSDYSQSHNMKKPAVPLKCWFVNCPVVNDVEQGS